MTLARGLTIKDRLLKQLGSILESHPELKSNFYVDFARRYEVVSLVNRLCKRGLRVADVGA